MKGLAGKYCSLLLIGFATFISACDEQSLDKEGLIEARPLTQEEVFLVQSSNDFAYRMLNENSSILDENISFSPISAGAALGIVGNTLPEDKFNIFKTNVGLPELSQLKINKAFYELSTMAPLVDEDVDVKFTNSIWTKYRISEVNDVYSKILAYFNADILETYSDRTFDEKFITKWIQAKSDFKYSRIDNFDNNVPFQVINLSHFSGSYFEDIIAREAEIDFMDIQGNHHKMMMNLYQNTSVNVNEYSDGLKSLSIPIGNGGYTLSIITGELGNTKISAHDLSPSDVKNYTGIALPDINIINEFTFDKSFSLYNVAQHLKDGLNHYLPEQAFLYSSTFLTKTAISITSKKTVNFRQKEVFNLLEEETIFTINQPFYFFITEQNSGLILFEGKYNYPVIP